MIKGVFSYRRRTKVEMRTMNVIDMYIFNMICVMMAVSVYGKTVGRYAILRGL